jgi:hypothetical protein
VKSCSCSAATCRGAQSRHRNPKSSVARASPGHQMSGGDLARLEVGGADLSLLTKLACVRRCPPRSTRSPSYSPTPRDAGDSGALPNGRCRRQPCPAGGGRRRSIPCSLSRPACGGRFPGLHARGEAAGAGRPPATSSHGRWGTGRMDLFVIKK